MSTLSILQWLDTTAAPPPGGRCLQADTPVLPWSDPGPLLTELALSRCFDLGEACRSAGLDPAAGMFSPRKLVALLQAVRQQAGPDTPFVLGRAWLPGHYGLASQALRGSPDLLEALRTLCRWSGRLCPLLTPRLLIDEHELVLAWSDAGSLPPGARALVVDLHMAAVALGLSALGEAPLDWSFSFNRTRPCDLSSHAAYLGPRLHFGCQVDALRLPLAQARRPWPVSEDLRQAQAFAHRALGLGADPQALGRGFVAAVHDRLLPCLADPPGVEALAAAFGMSPATFKRRLAQHGTHYQAELDQLRAGVALYLLGPQGQGNEAVAGALGFFDRANFRRFFKRWTGGLPGVAR